MIFSLAFLNESRHAAVSFLPRIGNPVPAPFLGLSGITQHATLSPLTLVIRSRATPIKQSAWLAPNRLSQGSCFQMTILVSCPEVAFAEAKHAG
jgi:hypothetical protein